MQSFNSRVINFLFLSGLFVVIVASFARYYYLKEFKVQIEVSCDTVTELCYHRDCDSGECPPNNLSDYRVFELSAKDFSQCEEVDECNNFCKTSLSACNEIKCDSNSDVCQGQQ